MRAYLCLLLSGAGLLSVAGSCSTDAPNQAPAVGEFFGISSEDSDLYAALVTDGSQAMVYVCDGSGISEWFAGSLPRDQGTLTNEGEASFAVARPTQDSVDSVLNTESSSLVVVVRRSDLVEADFGGVSVARAQLCRAEREINGVAYVGGWIVLPDGSQRGAVRGDDGTVIFADIDSETMVSEVPGLGTFQADVVLAQNAFR